MFIPKTIEVIDPNTGEVDNKISQETRERGDDEDENSLGVNEVELAHKSSYNQLMRIELHAVLREWRQAFGGGDFMIG